jgi:uncharacterized protein YhaN
MLIKSLIVEGVGRFTVPARVEGLREGVNVLAAGNEAGKSTLFRALRACLFSRHDSRGQEIRDLCADDSQLPASVELGFERDGRSYIIKKSFMRSPSATLIENGREIARSKRADEAVWDVLGLSPGSGRSLDEGAFGVLWVGQRSSFLLPIPGRAASSALNSAIESEVGTLVGGERARQVSEDIKAELRRSLTDTDRPKADGPLQRAMREADKWQAEEQAALVKVNALEQQFAQLRTRRERQKELTDPVGSAQLTAELAEARESLASARAAAEELRRFEAEETSAKRALDAASQRLKQFRDLTARIDANRAQEGVLADTLVEQRAKEQEVRDVLQRTVDQITQAEHQAQTLATSENQIEKLASAAVRAARKDDLARQLKGVQDAAAALTQIDAQLTQLPIRPKVIEELDSLERQIGTLEAQLSAAAARLAVEVKPAGTGKVLVTGLQTTDSLAGAIIALTTITVGDLATITLTPAPDPDHEERQALHDKHRSLLNSLSVNTSADARAMLVNRRELENDRKGVLAELRALKVTADTAAVIEKIQVELAAVDASIAKALADAKRDRLPTSKELEAEKLDLQQRRAPLDARRATFARMQIQQQNSVEAAIKAYGGTESTLTLVRKTIADDVALCPDADRSAREAGLVMDVTKAETTHQNAATLLSAKRQTVPDSSEIERRETRCQRLDQALENRRKERVELEGDIGRFTGQIQAAGGDGVGEALAVAQEQRTLTARELARAEERIATLKLLRDTIAGCLSETRDRYYAPVRRHLRPFLNDLFPGAELELDEGFGIAGIRRTRTEQFTRLSDGTQEQIAVLVRLAMASMLAEQGQIVPVVLDDALVYCDDDRIQRMFDALSRAGKQQQVIVLTCRLRAFSALGGNALRVQSS